MDVVVVVVVVVVVEGGPEVTGTGGERRLAIKLIGNGGFLPGPQAGSVGLKADWDGLS